MLARQPENVHIIPRSNFNDLLFCLDLTSEEIREKRRTERKQFKLDRARALAEAAAEAEAAFSEGREASVIAIPSGATWKPQTASADKVSSSTPQEIDMEEESVVEEPLEDIERLQLTMQEAFFLIWTMDCLTVLDSTTVVHHNAVVT